MSPFSMRSLANSTGKRWRTMWFEVNRRCVETYCAKLMQWNMYLAYLFQPQGPVDSQPMTEIWSVYSPFDVHVLLGIWRATIPLERNSSVRSLETVALEKSGMKNEQRQLCIEIWDIPGSDTCFFRDSADFDFSLELMREEVMLSARS